MIARTLSAGCSPPPVGPPSRSDSGLERFRCPCPRSRNGSSYGSRLAPFYDLVCTRVYKSLDRHLAMSIGEQFDPGAVLHRDFEAYARELRVGSRRVDETVAELLATGKQRLVLAITDFQERYGDCPILDMGRLQVSRNFTGSEFFTSRGEPVIRLAFVLAAIGARDRPTLLMPLTA